MPYRCAQDFSPAQIVKHGGFAAHVGFGQYLPIGVAHLGLIVGDEHADRQSLFVGHGQPHVLLNIRASFSNRQRQHQMHGRARP